MVASSEKVLVPGGMSNGSSSTADQLEAVETVSGDSQVFEYAYHTLILVLSFTHAKTLVWPFVAFLLVSYIIVWLYSSLLEK